MVLSKKEIGEKVKLARQIKSKQLNIKYTQNMLADDLKLSRGYIGDIEAGRTYPNYVLLNKIAEICGVPLGFFGEEQQSIGQAIAERRQELKVSQEELAKAVGVSHQYIEDLEDGKIKNPIIADLGKIAEELKMEPEYKTEYFLSDKYNKAREIETKMSLPTSVSEIPAIMITEDEIKLLSRFRKLSPASQATVLSLIDNLEKVEKTQSEQAADKEVG